ncbi:hypothetical protein TSTA_092020 [Talaromyces stipitatus ATCC 10500]|uniref:HAT C-terminal dimerisation domain-containing protein n=1 Tax=Talaromyces stipitatus (strain ATCC 10500 / CBS 375.48 / QM 6759 / NRRL 1006) TaxID=441959 RepID=B8M2P9_TALSN|nr:uncharacterized protein TSTA_092020 [Talaromyces stipitatus ATCC 10500]EED21960.1 hypothetical protein TSTA_092020 [Talaromyces stipitatus ATCC 10500]
MAKYDNSCNILYITMLLDPRFKKFVLEHKLQDEAKGIITTMQEQLEIQYPIIYKTELTTTSEEPEPSAAFQNPHKTIVSEMMSKIKAKSQKSAEKSSDIARYLNSDVVKFDEKKRNLIHTWWRGHIDECPRMAAAAWTGYHLTHVDACLCAILELARSRRGVDINPRPHHLARAHMTSSRASS